jgi:drug/metabolite transporter (DMT)-like permease
MWGLTSSFFSSLTWAIGSQTYTRLSREYPPYVINFNRAAVAFPFCIMTLLLQLGPQHLHEAISFVTNENYFWLGLSMVGSYAFADALFFLSARDLGVPIALAISALYPIWSALAGWIFNGETLVPIQWLGLLFAVAGVVVVILSARARLRPSDQSQPSGSEAVFVRGVALALVTSLLWSLNTYAVARGGANIHPMVAGGIRMIFAMVFAPAIGMIMGPRKGLLMKFSSYRKNAWVFVFESFGGSFFYLYGLTHAPLALASAMSSLAPALAVPIEWSQTRRPPRLDTMIGIILVIAGIILLVVKG